MMVAAIPLAALVTAFLLTGMVRRHALAANLMDVPDARRSHEQPTPRGGGLSIVVTVLAGLPLLWWGDFLEGPEFLALELGGGAVAAIGWADDQVGVAARWRLAVHLAAAIGVVFWAGSPGLPFPWDAHWGSTWLTMPLVALGIVWILNLFNFMDGIDGIAGTEAVTTLGLAALLLGSQGAWSWALVTSLGAGASLGFLLWNWPPAKIFMGDAGSGFLGFSLAALAVLTASTGALSLWVWLILLGAFIVDATLTLIRRVLRGERIYEAHRSHAYQFAARYFASHQRVTVGVGAINLLWLGPLALLATVVPSWGLGLTVLAWAPLGLLALHFDAGKAEPPKRS